MSQLQLIVKARFLEAADTDDRLPSARLKPQAASGYWPEYHPTFEDMAGWGTQRLAEDREMRFRRIPPSAAAIQRHGEVLDWTRLLIDDPERRKIVWAWAFCCARERSFGKWCRDTGRVKNTALRRLERVFDAIAREIRGSGDQPTLPDEKWLLRICPETGINPAILDAEPARKASAWIDPTHRPADLITTPKAVAAFEAFLARTNSRRRKEQMRRAA